jgi:ketosteroid isomerase-like protein
MSPDGQTRSNEDAIRRCIESVARAIRARDADALMVNYASDVVVYDVFPPLEVHGADAYRQNFERWFARVRGDIGYEVRGLHITVAGGHAFCRCLGHVTATTQNGDILDYWVRVTSELEDREGAWRITHEHVSLPAKR